jgi:transcriptional regulator with XRE-family HTH domain
MLRHQEIREMRELAGVSVRQAAKAAGVSHGQLGNFESGKAVPTTKQLAMLGKCYSVEIRGRLVRLWKLIGLMSA